MNDPVLGPIDQIGYVVADLDRSIARWRERHAIGPWTVFRNVRLDGHHLGEPVSVTMDVGLAYRGNLQIELIHVTNDTSSPYRDVHGQPLVGLHHVAYLDDPDDPGVRVEFIEGAGIRDMIARGIAESHTRDGTDPVRIIDAAAASA
ncbi:VOC family protein [Burkholderia cepacia]|uniref:VOC family protein n=1 Tax=Burkholderia cepacia TaxID=292 RepID=UPI002FE3F6AE